MIAKEKSQRIKQLKYLLVIPLLIGMLIYSSCTEDVQLEIENIETTINEGDIPSEVKYIGSKNGFLTFIGTHLVGKVVPKDEYSEKETEVINKFGSVDVKEKFDISIVIDKNGDRVYFFKMKNALSKKNHEIKNDDGSIPFAVIEEVPVFPGCETSDDPRKCLQDKITEHVGVNFNANLADDLGLTAGVKRIFVMFKISKEGKVTDVQARAPHKNLQEEAIRVVKSLPDMIPGKYKGNSVGVKYSLPIAFKVEGDGGSTGADKKYNNPIYIVNGKEISKSVFKSIKPDAIKSIEVINGENAIEKYGEKGTQGVVEVILKEE